MYLDRNDLRLTYEGKALVIYQDGRRQSTVPINFIERLVMLGNVNLDSGLLGFLAESGVGIVVLSGRHHSRLAVLVGRPHNDAERRLAQYRLSTDVGWRIQWSRRLVRHKLAAQTRMLRHAAATRADLSFSMRKGLDGLARIRESLAQRELDLDSIRGLEGAGAAAFFGAFTQLFADSLSFNGRNRRPPRDPVNAVLSLGYTLLHSEAVLAAHLAGLDPMVGFFHEPAFGRESLAADLVEPVRSYIDRLAWELFRDRQLRPEHFGRDGEACLLDKTGRAAFYPAYEAMARPIRRGLRRFCVHLAKALPTMSLTNQESP